MKQDFDLNREQREKIVHLEDVLNSDKSLLGCIIINYMQHLHNNSLSSKGEYIQSYAEMRNDLITGYNKKTLRAQLKRLVKGGYITYEYKAVKHMPYSEWAIHLSATDKALQLINEK